jgi:hypothetical protein
VRYVSSWYSLRIGLNKRKGTSGNGKLLLTLTSLSHDKGMLDHSSNKIKRSHHTYDLASLVDVHPALDSVQRCDLHTSHR